VLAQAGVVLGLVVALNWSAANERRRQPTPAKAEPAQLEVL
jgi:hypothetical protein